MKGMNAIVALHFKANLIVDKLEGRWYWNA